MAEQDPTSEPTGSDAAKPASTPEASGTPSAQSSADAMAEAALKAAQDAISSLQGGFDPSSVAPAPGGVAFSDEGERPESEAAEFPLPAFAATPQAAPPKGIDLLSDVNLHVKIELGRTRMLVEDVLKLGEGAVVELDKLAGDPVDVFVNDRHIARGEVLVLNDNFCVRINEIVGVPSEIESKSRGA